MTEAAAADAVLDVKDEIVAWTGSDAHGNRIEPERTASFPRNNMVGAGCISADAEPTNKFTFLAVECESSTEDDHTTNRFADHGIVLYSKLLWIAEMPHSDLEAC